jgi:hypothetical protein
MFAATILALALLQTGNVKNPRTIEFVCADHATDDQHEVDIVRNSDGVVIQTVLLGDPVAVSGVVTATINVQPVAFGTYFVRVRAVAGALKSEDSVSSNLFDRVPGAPSSVVVR